MDVNVNEMGNVITEVYSIPADKNVGQKATLSVKVRENSTKVVPFVELIMLLIGFIEDGTPAEPGVVSVNCSEPDIKNVLSAAQDTCMRDNNDRS